MRIYAQTQEILAEIKKNSTVTTNQLATILGITQRAIEKQIASLKQTGKITRVGSKKSGHWKIEL